MRAEFVILVPCKFSQYAIAQRYTVALMSKEGMGDGSSVVIHVNEPSDNGQYTRKTYNLGGKLPRWISRIVPASGLLLDEEAYNAFPNCKTTLTHRTVPLIVTIESRHTSVPHVTADDAHIIDLRGDTPYTDCMMCHKTVTVECGVPLIGKSVERYVCETQKTLFEEFHLRLAKERIGWETMTEDELIVFEQGLE